MRSLRLPPLTEESRYCRDGHHKTMFTSMGQCVALITLAVIMLAVSISVNFLAGWFIAGLLGW